MLSEKEAQALVDASRKNSDVIFPLMNGQELNSKPLQEPGRKIINFFDWPAEAAARYKEPFQRIEHLVRPVRTKNNRAVYRDKWWLYGESRPKLMSKLQGFNKCFVTAANTKYLNFSMAQKGTIFTHTIFVLATDRWDLYAVVQSTLHEIWARKYSGTLKQDLRYSPSKCFETFAFPENLWRVPHPNLAAIGERYHEHRCRLMHDLWLGLTDLYNLFHAPALTPALVAKISRKPAVVAQAGYEGLLELRRLHVALDTAVRDAYGWQDLDLGHDFVAVETLPEKDRVRFTISPTARRELLRRLLVLNHERAEAEKQSAATKTQSAVKRRKRDKQPVDGQTAELFGKSEETAEQGS